MTRTNERPAHLNDFYRADGDYYDLDAYDVAYTLDNAGYLSKALRDNANADYDYMEAYNAASDHKAADRPVAAWRAVFVSLLAALVGVFGTMIVIA